MVAADSERLFFALWPDAVIQEKMRFVSKQVLKGTNGKPVAAENYHMTLAFLGNVPRKQIANTIDVARDVRFDSFTLQLDCFACWSRSKIGWLGTQQCPTALSTLVMHLGTALKTIGFKPDARPYVPHVTIARRVAAARDIRVETESIIWPSSEFVLVRSETLPTGPVYTRLESFPAAD